MTYAGITIATARTLFVITKIRGLVIVVTKTIGALSIWATAFDVPSLGLVHAICSRTTKENKVKAGKCETDASNINTDL